MYTPTKAVGLALNILRNTIAATATFRALTGAATQAEALMRVCFDTMEAIKDPSSEQKLFVPRPRAVVRIAEGWMLASMGVGSYRHILPLYMRLELTIPPEVGGEPVAGDLASEFLWFSDQWYALVREMTVLMRAGADGDGNRMLASDSSPRIVEQPDEYFNDDDAIDERWYGVGMVWTIEAPGP